MRDIDQHGLRGLSHPLQSSNGEQTGFDDAWRRRSSNDVVAASDDRIARVEAALFVADRPLSPGRIAKAALLSGAAEARGLIEGLQRQYESQRSPFSVEKLASGYRLMTKPDIAYYLAQVAPHRDEYSLSPAMLETLTIVAYRQPVTRAEVESIRGVASLELMKQLMDRGFVKIVGEDDSLGRPFLYGTTPQFLDAFGLGSLDELSDRETLAA